LGLEGQKLVQLLFISVPNFIIFLLTVHRDAIDFHLWNNSKKKTNRYNRCLSTFGAWPLKRITVAFLLEIKIVVYIG